MVEVVHARLTLIKQVVYACVSCKHSLPTTVVLVQAGPVRRSGDFSTPLSTGERSIVTSVSVCVCVRVCLSVREHIFGTTRPIFIKLFVHVTYGRGSVLL